LERNGFVIEERVVAVPQCESHGAHDAAYGARRRGQAFSASSSEGRCLSLPAWVENPEFGQYFASFELSGIRVEFSTVESNATGSEFGECSGDAPWEHFDFLELEGHRVAVVASELRLLSEIMRFRPDRWEPIAAHLSRHGYDEGLLAAAIQRLPPDLQATMRDALHRTTA
jgi:hypothetical protein